MSARAGPLAKSDAAEARTMRAAILSATAINLLCLAYLWGEWSRFLFFLATMAGLTLANALLIDLLARRIGVAHAELARMAMNTLGIVWQGHVVGWILPVFLWIPYITLLIDRSRADLRIPSILSTAIIGGVALQDGASPSVVVTFIVFAAICYVVATTRVQSIRDLLAESEQRAAEIARAHEELKRAQVQLVRQEKLSSLGLLAAGIAHEINNPMSFVTSNVKSVLLDLDEMAADPALREEYRTDVLPGTLDGIARVNTIVADMRRFARGDPEAMVEYDLDEQVRAAARIAHSRFGTNRRLNLSLSCDVTPLGRPGQITQVVINLLVNAAQAIGEGGTVSATTGNNDEEVWLQVRDDGVGMDEETRQKLFQPFFTTKPVGEGTGLGLAVIHGIVKAHSGTIDVDTAPGKGSCFTVRMPLVPAPGGGEFQRAAA